MPKAIAYHRHQQGNKVRIIGLFVAVGCALLAVSPSLGKPAAKPAPRPAPPVLQCGRDAFVPAKLPASAVETTPSGLRFQTIKPGTGGKPTLRDYTLVGYKGSLTNGTVFDQNERTPFPVAGVVPGFSEALQKMQKGGVYRICIPAALGYGADSPAPTIPANSVLRFEVSLLDYATPEQIEASRQSGQPAE